MSAPGTKLSRHPIHQWKMDALRYPPYALALAPGGVRSAAERGLGRVPQSLGQFGSLAISEAFGHLGGDL
jgi:hypothetical protein